jgi:hypothetical protein
MDAPPEPPIDWVAFAGDVVLVVLFLVAMILWSPTCLWCP